MERNIFGILRLEYAGLITKHEIKMAGSWPSWFLCSWTEAN